MNTPSEVTADIIAGVRRVFPAVPAPALHAFQKWLLAPSEAVRARPAQSFAKPYGTNHILEIVGNFGVSCACFDPGQETSYHRHFRRTEFYCVRTGVLELLWEDRELTLGPFQYAHSRPGESHRLRNVGTSVLEVLELFRPPLLDDKVRIGDRYGRRLGGVSRDE